MQEIPGDDKLKYIDDLSAVEAQFTEGKFIDYDTLQHVPSDVAICQQFLPQISFKTQTYNDFIVDWSERNKMVLKQDKSNYIVISRSTDQFSTRLHINVTILERKEETCHLGVWLNESLYCEKHVSEI